MSSESPKIHQHLWVLFFFLSRILSFLFRYISDFWVTDDSSIFLTFPKQTSESTLWMWSNCLWPGNLYCCLVCKCGPRSNFKIINNSDSIQQIFHISDFYILRYSVIENAQNIANISYKFGYYFGKFYEKKMVIWKIYSGNSVL